MGIEWQEVVRLHLVRSPMKRSRSIRVNDTRVMEAVRVMVAVRWSQSHKTPHVALPGRDQREVWRIDTRCAVRACANGGSHMESQSGSRKSRSVIMGTTRIPLSFGRRPSFLEDCGSRSSSVKSAENLMRRTSSTSVDFAKSTVAARAPTALSAMIVLLAVAPRRAAATPTLHTNMSAVRRRRRTALTTAIDTSIEAVKRAYMPRKTRRSTGNR